MEDLSARLEQQRKIVEASYALHTSLDLAEVLKLILDAATEGVAAERGTVFLLSEDHQELWSSVIAGNEHVEIRLPVGQGIAGQVATTGQTVRLSDAYKDPSFDPSWDKRSGFRTKQILCAPIRNRDERIVGCFQLLNTDKEAFSDADEDFLASLSVHAALAVENARLHNAALERERQAREIDLALQVQRQFQPEFREDKRGQILVAGMNELCEDASGDYYDFLSNQLGGKLAIAVGDVSGHGLQAALLMAETRALLRAFISTAPDVAAAFDLLNDHLVPDMADGKFVSLFGATVDPATGRVEWCNAGHCPPLHYQARTGEMRELTKTGVVLGVLSGVGYDNGEPFLLEPGDALLIFTDGVTEAQSPTKECLGDERLQAVFRENGENPPKELLHTIRTSIRDWTGSEQNEDDLTVVAVRHEPSK